MLTGINENGLTIALLISFNGRTNIAGMPNVMLFRKILEEASNIEETLKIVENSSRTAPVNLAAADVTGKSAIIECTSDKIAVRPPNKEGFLFCTNWFRSPEMPSSAGDERYQAMQTLTQWFHGKITLSEIIGILKSVPVSGINLQSMVIFPRDRVLYLATGSIPATRGEFRRVDLSNLLK